jgi:hypothetical protein
MSKTKLTGAALRFFQKVGRRGAKISAEKFDHKQRKAWGSLGGRPRSENTLKILDALKDGPKSRIEISQQTKIKVSAVTDALNNLRIRGAVINPSRGKWELNGDSTAKSKAENQDRQQKPRRQVPSQALAS